MLSLSQIKLLCTQYDIAPTKSRGQNFLIDENIIDQIIAAARLSSRDVVLEVGPGFGVLTYDLSKSVKKLIAVELDYKLMGYLQTEFSAMKNVEVVSGDILKLNMVDLGFTDHKYKIVSNLPYNITSKFLRVFLELQVNSPDEMVLMVQKEVGERIVAGSGAMSLLSLMVQFYAKPEILFPVSKNCFWPVPQVDSVVMRIKRRAKTPNIDPKEFWRLAHMGFASKRKQLHNNLAGGLHKSAQEVKTAIVKTGFDERARAQDLGVEDWVRLLSSLRS